MEASRPDSPRGTARFSTVLLEWVPVIIVATTPLVLLRRLATPIQDPDTFWHVVAGRQLWSTWQFAGQAPWPPAANRPWVLHEWLPELALAAADHLWGLRGVAFAQTALALALMLSLYWCCSRFSRPLPAAIATLLGWLGVSASVSARPQVVTFILLGVTTAAWLRTAADGRPRWWLVPLSYLWSCSHGLWPAGVMVGGAVVCGLVADRSYRPPELLRLACIPTLSVAGGVVTPAGPGLLLASREIGKSTQYVEEWSPASLRSPYLAATIAMAAVVLVVWARRQTKTSWAHLAVWLLAVAWALTYGRTVALGAVMLAPLAAGAVDSVLPRERRTPVPAVAHRLIVAGGFGSAAVVALFVASATSSAPEGVPTHLDSALSRLPSGTVVFNDYALGGWLLYKHPNVAAVIDGRSELYAHSYVADYVSALSATPGWERTVAATHARYALLPGANALAGALEGQWHWTRQADQQGFVLLVAPRTPAE